MPSKPPLETPARIEPCFPEETNDDLLDLLTELPAAAGRLGARLHPRTAANLADLVRVMNCYYSNLIEGHHTRPRDIERALRGDLDADEGRRNLQLEARAHIRIQKMLDEEFERGALPDAASIDFIRWLHLEFYRDAPEAMLWTGDRTHEGRGFKMTPGSWRRESMHDVAVGRHVPPGSAVVEDFMKYFARRYSFAGLGAARRILAIPAAHHRLNYIHPFPDGNGRVSRLMSHAMGRQADIGAQGLWSISRGLARGIESRGEYKRMMDYADTPRQGDTDGRGNLSSRALEEFSIWFLRVCHDQVRFMSDLFELDGLADRLRRYAQISGLRDEAGRLLTETLHRGEIARGDASAITGLGERTARNLLGELLRNGILGSASEKGPVSLRFPASALDILFPRLFAEA